MAKNEEKGKKGKRKKEKGILLKRIK